MKKFALIITVSLSIFIGNQTYAQTKKVLLEVFSGAKCGNCPMGAYTLDSLLNIHPNLVGVSLHSYFNPDAMFFEEIDTIGLAYAPGAPAGATNRIFWGEWDYVAELMTDWGNRVESEIMQEAEVEISVSSVWNSLDREISATIATEILTDLPMGDYRFSLYVVEDSVSGIGSGYDQINYYNNTIGNPFYGMGNPITGYVHKHVVRAILPQAWGQAGIIPSNPLAGQNFSTTINYILPNEFNENKIKLVAFVNKYSEDHLNDKVLNVEEIPLIQTGTSVEKNEKYDIMHIYPNPSNGLFEVTSNLENTTCFIYNSVGELVFEMRVAERNILINLIDFSDGLYIIVLKNAEQCISSKIIINRNYR
jgi:hypothetical protein